MRRSSSTGSGPTASGSIAADSAAADSSASGSSTGNSTGTDLLDPALHAGELRPWLRLQSVLGLSPESAASLLRCTGSPRAALLASGEESRAPSPRELEAALRSLTRCAALGLPLTSAAYPPGLAALPDPALLLFVQGNVAALKRSAVAIVGARAATGYGLDVARELAGELARRGAVIVSGLARGIDGVAHRAALEAGGESVAVQACGPDRVYPPEHAALARDIRQSGAVITELPPGTPPRAPFFPLRNRLISALARVVVVVEARHRSGSLITARHGLAQGIDVMAVPGPIGVPTSEGTNRLIRDGAPPVLGVQDVLDRLDWVHCPPPDVEGPEETATGHARTLLDSLSRSPATRDELCRTLGRSPAQLALCLVDLQLDGRVSEDRDGRLHVRRGRPARGGSRPGSATS